MAPWAASATPQGIRSGAVVVSAWARFGMLFQKPTPFPMSIYENIAFGSSCRATARP